MRHWFLVLMIALLPLRGWVGDAMAMEMLAQPAHAGMVMDGHGADHADHHAAHDYMVMGERGMADMGEMEMELPTNTFPMMTGTGPYGPIEMGGMFTTLKVRADQKAGDYTDPGVYKMPPGTQARLVDTGTAPAAARPAAPASTTAPAATVRKPAGGHGNH